MDTITIREKTQRGQVFFNQAMDQKRYGNYREALKLYKKAYEAFPEDPDLQSTMYAMAKIYLLIDDYEKACALFQDGLTMKLAQTDERTGRFYQKYVMSKYTGGLSEYDPDYQWFQKITADYSIFIGLSHYLLENEGYELLSQYRYDFNNHMQSVAGKPAAQPSIEYLRTCYDYGWLRVIAIASESYDRCFDKIDFGHLRKRKQEFLDILKTIGKEEMDDNDNHYYMNTYETVDYPSRDFKYSASMGPDGNYYDEWGDYIPEDCVYDD